jgi:hypothetical protein
MTELTGAAAKAFLINSKRHEYFITHIGKAEYRIGVPHLEHNDAIKTFYISEHDLQNVFGGIFKALEKDSLSGPGSLLVRAAQAAGTKDFDEFVQESKGHYNCTEINGLRYKRFYHASFGLPFSAATKVLAHIADDLQCGAEATAEERNFWGGNLAEVTNVLGPGDDRYCFRADQTRRARVLGTVTPELRFPTSPKTSHEKPHVLKGDRDQALEKLKAALQVPASPTIRPQTSSSLKDAFAATTAHAPADYSFWDPRSRVFRTNQTDRERAPDTLRAALDLPVLPNARHQKPPVPQAAVRTAVAQNFPADAPKVTEKSEAQSEPVKPEKTPAFLTYGHPQRFFSTSVGRLWYRAKYAVDVPYMTYDSDIYLTMEDLQKGFGGLLEALKLKKSELSGSGSILDYAIKRGNVNESFLHQFMQETTDPSRQKKDTDGQVYIQLSEGPVQVTVRTMAHIADAMQCGKPSHAAPEDRAFWQTHLQAVENRVEGREFFTRRSWCVSPRTLGTALQYPVTQKSAPQVESTPLTRQQADAALAEAACEGRLGGHEMDAFIAQLQVAVDLDGDPHSQKLLTQIKEARSKAGQDFNAAKGAENEVSGDTPPRLTINATQANDASAVQPAALSPKSFA